MKTSERPINTAWKNLLARSGIFFCSCLWFLACAVSANAAAPGKDGVFLVDRGYDYSNRDRVEASMIYESEDAYIYMDDQYLSGLSAVRRSEVIRQLSELGEDFDDVIYPTDRRIFGEEWNPGIDGSGKLLILFTRMDYNIGGYFNPNDEYPKAQVEGERSNENEMIYLNPDFLGSGKVEGFLAHEFQHMIYWNEKTRLAGLVDEVWLNEARSELASSIVESELNREFEAGTLSVRKKDFLVGYYDSVADWRNANRDYATANLFAQYLRDHFGTGLFRSMNTSRKIGMSSLDSVLRREENITLGGAFTNWTLANYINDTAFDLRYGYENKDLKTDFNIVPSAIYDKDEDGKINLTDTLANWSGGYYKMDLKGRAGQNLEVTFDGADAGDFVLAYVINYANGHREVGFVELNPGQDGGKYIAFPGGDANSIVFIPSSQKLEAVDGDNRVASYDFSLEAKFVQPRDKTVPDGTLVKLNADDRIYLLEAGAKRWVPDAETFIAQGFDWKKVVVVSAVELSLYPDGPDVESVMPPTSAGAVTDGSLVQGDGAKVYYLDDGAKRWIVDAATFVANGFDWNRIVKVSQQELLHFADGESLTKPLFAEGTLLRGVGAPRVYRFELGAKRWITSPQAFNRGGYDWTAIVEIPAGAVSSIRDGKDIE